MQYLGGKARIAKKFAPILSESLRRTNGRFIEPFVGGFNLLPALHQSVLNAECSDLQPGLFRLYQALQNGWEPPLELTEGDYQSLRRVEDWGNPLTTFAAFGCSFGGKEWGGYARNSRGDNYVLRAKNSLLKKRKFMLRVEFSCQSYLEISFSKFSTIYCDPPYRNTTGYKTGIFDYDVFYDWCEEIVRRGNEVFVSEFIAPEHWSIVWQLERKMNLRRIDKSKITDKLFEVVPR